MASQTQFKQQCPSCEAMVPIKDATFVGKKVDCPKCKYRFVVEDPGNVSDEKEAAEPKSKIKRKSEDGTGGDKPKSKIRRPDGADASGVKKKKPKEEKKKSNTMLFVGIGLGVVAVIGLIVGAIVIFSGGGTSSKANPVAQKPPVNNPPVNNPPVNNPNPPNPGNTGANNNPQTGGAGSSPATAAGTEKIVTDPVRAIASNLLPNDSQVVYSVNMHQFMRSTLYGAAFNSASGFKVETFSKKLGLPLDKMKQFVRAENLKNGWAFNVVQMGAGFTLSSEEMRTKLGGQKGPKTPIKGHDYYLVSPNEDLDALSSIDFSSIINPRELKPKTSGGQMAWHIYDSRTLIVAEVNQMEQFLQSERKPELLSKLTEEALAALTTKKGDNSAPEPDNSGGPGGKGISSDRVLKPGVNQPPTTTTGSDNDQRYFTDKPTYLTVKPELKQLLEKMEESRNPVIFSCAGIDLESVNQKLVDAIRATTNVSALVPLNKIVAAAMGLQTLSDERATAIAALALRREDDARMLHDALRKSFLARAAAKLGAWFNVTLETGLVDTPTTPDAPQQPGPSMPSGNPGSSGGASRVPPGAGPTGSGSGGASGGIGLGGPPRPPAGSGPAAPGSSTSSGAKSSMTVEFHDKIIYITVDAQISQETNRKIYQEVEAQVVRIKGATDVVAMTRPRLHELASAANQFRAEKYVLHGTYPLKGDASGVVFVSQSPNQRVSWMVDLLPHLNHGDVFAEIDPKQSWRVEKNLRAGNHWIPEFIDPTYPRDSWTARVPSLPGSDLGATNFTGLSGIGLEAAEFPDDPAHRHKLGMFGYDRPTSFDDVPDGLSNTIFLIETPPTFPRPWIAGGGATVQGVPEKNSIAPFVYNHGDKQGTYALMCDGSVRWLSADTPDKLFQALVTRAGNDSVGNLDAAAPLVSPSNGSQPKSKQGTSATSADQGASERK